MTTQKQAIQPQRSAILTAIVAYKVLVVFALVTISVMSAFSWRNYDTLVVLAQENLADGEVTLSDWFLKTVMQSQVSGLRWVARIAGIYAIVMGIATVGLWYAKKWANPLMILMVGLPIPIEVQELLHDPSWRRLMILLLNLTVLGYLLKHYVSQETL